MNPPINLSIQINAPAKKVWAHLTDPGLMTKWTAEPELKIKIITDWKIGGPMIISGFHHAQFENTGTVMQFEPYSIIRYSHLSSVSRLPDLIENYSIHTFELNEETNCTVLKLQVENFPTETIYKHLDFYWKGTLFIIKQQVEKSNNS